MLPVPRGFPSPLPTIAALTLVSLFAALSAADEPPAERRTGELLTVELPGGAAMEFVWIEPGTFLMGSPPREKYSQKTEKPQRQVTISRGFYLGRYEITQGQWESVLGARPWEGEKWVRSDPRHPAVFISWEDVQTFARRLNQAAGGELYRLPTEAEWEYACRAGTRVRWSFGDDPDQLGDFAWYIGNIGEEIYAHPTGVKRPNPWGLYDMHGNVWEWCQDWHAKYPEDAQTDPAGPDEGLHRIKRGGSFFSQMRRDPAQVISTRSAHREYHLPSLGYAALGARLVRVE